MGGWVDGGEWKREFIRVKKKPRCFDNVLGGNEFPLPEP